MAHEHGHGHGHGHHHGTAEGRLGVAFGLNVTFTVVELVGAWFTGSTAIAADALHDLGDSLSLAFAWGMQGLSERQPSREYSYGYRRLSLVGALVNAMVLLFGGLTVLSEAIPRLWDPGEPSAEGMLALAVLGVAVNGVAALRVGGGSTLNERVVSWHLLEDVLGWVAVLIVSLVMLVVDLPVLDPLLSIAITVFIGFGAAKNLRGTIRLFLQATPDDVDLEALTARVLQVDGVVALKHVHVWSQEGEHHVLTGHVGVERERVDEALAVLAAVREVLADAGIVHATLELMADDVGEGCHGH